MECSILSLAAMLAGAVFLFLTKNVYKFKVFIIFLLISLGTFLKPVLDSISKGNWSELPMEFSVFFQPFKLIIDPFSAFTGLLVVIIFALYLYKLFTDKNCRDEVQTPEIVMLTLLGFSSLLFFQNTIFFIIAYLTLTAILLHINSYIKDLILMRKNALFIYFCNALIVLTVILLSVFSNDFNFNAFVNPLVKNSNFGNCVFLMTFIGFGLPFIFQNRLFCSKNFQKLNPPEIFILKQLYSLMYIYCLFRFTVMGAVPYFVSNICIIAGILAYGIVKLCKLIRSNDVNLICSNLNSIGLILTLLSVLVGINGYIYNLPVLSILSYTAAFIFYINTILHSYLSEFDTKNEKKLLFNICSLAGIPLTLSFWGWLFLFSVLFIGIGVQNISLKIILFIITLFVCITLLSLLCKMFFILKDYRTQKDEMNYQILKPTLLFNILIVLAGIFSKEILTLIFVPVSLFTGGTKFYETFNALTVLAKNINVYILCAFGLIILLCIIKLLVLNRIKPNQKV